MVVVALDVVVVLVLVLVLVVVVVVAEAETVLALKDELEDLTSGLSGGGGRSMRTCLGSIVRSRSSSLLFELLLLSDRL